MLDAAAKAKSNAYAPYSVYPVGAAVQSAGGKVYAGCNVENVSFGLTVCAERNAIARMVADGETELKALALVTEDGASPCGACLQVIAEFANGADIPIYLADAEGHREESSLGALFPKGFASPGLKRR